MDPFMCVFAECRSNVNHFIWVFSKAGILSPPLFLSLSWSRVSIFIIPSPVTGFIGSLGELLALALLCRWFLSWVIQIEMQIVENVGCNLFCDGVYTNGNRAWSKSDSSGSTKWCFDKDSWGRKLPAEVWESDAAPCYWKRLVGF